jgi:hypothetical protein
LGVEAAVLIGLIAYAAYGSKKTHCSKFKQKMISAEVRAQLLYAASQNINDMNIFVNESSHFPKEFRIYSTCVDAQNNVYVLGDELIGPKKKRRVEELWVGAIYKFDHKRPTRFHNQKGHSGDISDCF